MDCLLDRRRLLLTSGAVAGFVLAERHISVAGQEASPEAGAADAGNAGTITGTVTDTETGEPLADVYVAVGWQSVQRVGISDEEGRYAVDNIPTSEAEEVDLLGFREGGYRYHNSRYDADTLFTLEPGETVSYDFTLTPLPEEGQPEVSDPLIEPRRAAPGEEVTFAVTARGGAGGLSNEVLAASPELGRMVLMEQGEGDRWSTSWTVPEDAEGGEYEFGFVAVSNECYDNGEFPRLTLTIAGQDDSQEATPAAEDSDGAGAEAVTVEMIDIEFNPNEFTIPADTDVTITLPNNGQTVHDFNIDGNGNPSDPGIHSGDVNPGEETTVTVNLPAGDWYYYCSIPGHEAAGMHGTIHVEE